MGKVSRLLVRLAKWVVFAFFGLLMLAIGGVRSPFPDTEITHQKPYADFIGREYRVVSDVSAHAWNDFPDKAKIEVITLLPPPGFGNRFVSYVTPIKEGQRVRIVSAWRQIVLFGFHKYYVVLVPGAGLPEGVDIKISVNSDGVLDPLVYEPIDR
jgi:hypothetical protein